MNEPCNDQRAITADTALMLARVFGNSADCWLNVQRRNDLWDALHPPERRQVGADRRAEFGRQGKSLAVRWSEVSEEIGIFELPKNIPRWTLSTESSMISTLRTPSIYPTAAESAPLIRLLQYDNYML